LYSTGIRRIELVQIKLAHININERTLLVVHGKGDRDRMVPVGERAISWVIKYLQCSQALRQVSDDDALFLGSHGMSITPGWLSAIISKYITEADIGKTGSCHMFRHSMATGMLENGADIRYIQMMLGHSSLKSTQIYTKVSIAKLKEVHGATHPVKQKTDA